MASLEDYLADEYHRDMSDIRSLEEALERAMTVFVSSSVAGQWPYEVRASPAPPSGVSHGTQAMILASLGKVGGFCSLATHRKAGVKISNKLDVNQACHAGATVLLGSLLAQGAVRSKSFGRGDPITLSHIAELLRGMGDPQLLGTSPQMGPDKATILAISNFVRSSRATAYLRGLVRRDLELRATLIPALPIGSRYLRNAFVPLRVVRAFNDLRRVGIIPRQQVIGKGFRRFFEGTLHAQLSFSQIPDSRFDPAELIYCLEGLLICAPQAVDEQLFRRVLDVLGDKQALSANWRPNKPMFSTPQGMTMLPVSVEGAISLLRSVALKDGLSDYQPLSTAVVAMMRRFWAWIRAREVQFEGFSGWHSEHVNDPELIQLWDTSQVIEFMLAYRELLQRSIAGRTLLLSRLDVSISPTERLRNWRKGWTKSYRKFEPALGANKSRQIYRRLYTDFVRPWGVAQPRNYSFLLYGPPGTGKSSVAKTIATSLGLRMITVTVSDFLGRGGENVEARAKAIFQTLEAQHDAVILFDEIDSFLLDRDSKLYRKQDTQFQFLTPGMLTKINDLRSKERSIFIIATNFENRIDPAIKRPGRIDERYVLLPPDRAKRAAILKGDLLQNRLVGLTSRELLLLADGALYLGYKEMEGAVRRAGGKDAGRFDLYRELRTADRSTSPAHYFARLRSESIFPRQELKALIAMAMESRGLRRINEAVQRLSATQQQILAQHLAP